MEKTINFPFKAIVGYDNGRDVFLVYKNKADEKSMRRYRNYPWYFALDKKYPEKIEKLARHPKIKIIETENYYKVYCPKDWDHKDFRQELRQKLEENGMKPLEFDLSLTKRFMIDNLIEVEDSLKIGFIDIETDDSFGKIIIGQNRIICWSICDQEGNVVFKYDKNEQCLLEELIPVMDKYDVLCGWNSEQFDFPYIKARMDVYQISYNWKKIIEFDLMKRLIKLFGPMMTTVGLPGFSLEEVSQTFLKKGKVHLIEKINWLEKNDLKKLEEYNKTDVLLLYELDKKLMLFDLMIKECVWTGTFLNRFYVGELLDNYILREAKKHNKHLASQREYSKDRIPIQGAYVMEPVVGLHEKIRVFDFKCLAKGTKIFTDRGYTNIENVNKKNKIQDIDGNLSEIKTISKNKYSGLLKKITTTNGYTVCCTPNHKWPLIDKNKIILKEAKDLTIKDSLLSPLFYTFKENENTNELLYELLGIFYFEATVKKIKHRTKKNYISDDYRVELSLLKKEIEFKKRITWLLKKIDKFDFEWLERRNSYYLKIGNKLSNHKRNTKEIYEWFTDNFKKLETTEFLNNSINMARFCFGAFNSDGSVNVNRNTIVINSGIKYKKERNNRIDLLHHILKRLKIHSNFGRYNNTKILEIYRRKDLETFENKISFVSSDKTKKLRNSIMKKSNKTKTSIIEQNYIKRNILKIEDEKYNDYVYNLGMQKQDKPFYIANDLLTKNSMYPSIIVGFNISHDTIIDIPENDCIKSTNGYYYSKRKGVYSDLIKYLLDMRKSYKSQQIESEYGSIEYNNAKSMQEVVKELSNSMYGITADPNSRFFDKRIAESITLGGQYLLSKSKEFIEEMGYRVLYQDTDSLFVKVDDQEKINSILLEVNQKLKDHLVSTFNISDYIIDLQYEKTFDPLILVEKKRYSGLMTDLDGKPVNKIFTRGLEVIKKDTIEFTRKKLIEMLNYILIDRKGLPFFTSWLENVKNELFINTFTANDLKITKKVSRPIGEYKTKLPHVRLAERLIKDGKILETIGGKHVWGQKIEYIIVNDVRNWNTKEMHSHERITEVLAENYTGEFDKVYYWNIQVFNVLYRTLNAVFPEYDWKQYIVKKIKKSNEKQLLLF